VHERITIGDDFLTAGNLYINSGSHDLDTLEPRSRAITIGNRVWIGANSTVVAGANIGSNVVIGAGSLVRGTIPSNHFAAGVPARPIRSICREGRSLWSWAR
jgi:acetyltransferase-like isoleucine patch superfamily enzyme